MINHTLNHLGKESSMDKIISITLIILFILCSLTKSNAQTQADPGQTNHADSLKIASENQRKELALKLSSSDITHMIIHTDSNNYGYYIFIDGDMVIEQRSIPAVGGKMGFKNGEDATIVAGLVITKLKAGDMPPSVTIVELNQLHISTAKE